MSHPHIASELQRQLSLSRTRQKMAVEMVGRKRAALATAERELTRRDEDVAKFERALAEAEGE